MAIVVAAVAAPASAAVKTSWSSELPDYGAAASRFQIGLACGAVPVSGGGTRPYGVLDVRPSGKQRVVPVEYGVSFFTGLGPMVAWMPVGVGRVQVLDARVSSYGVVEETGRADVRTRRRDVCGLDDGRGTTVEVGVQHLVPIQPPTVAQIEAWCAQQPWYQPGTTSCPTGAAAR